MLLSGSTLRPQIAANASVIVLMRIFFGIAGQANPTILIRVFVTVTAPYLSQHGVFEVVVLVLKGNWNCQATPS